MTEAQIATMTNRAWQEHLSHCLRNHVGRHKARSVEEVACLLDVSGTLVRMWRDETVEKSPTARDVFRLMAILGTAFTNEVLAFCGYAGARPIISDDVCPLDVMAHAGKCAATTTAAAADGDYDHDECGQIRNTVTELYDAAMRLKPGPLQRVK